MRKEDGEFNLVRKNLFSLDRLESDHNFEAGTNLTVGLDYEIDNEINKTTFSIGQIINEKKSIDALSLYWIFLLIVWLVFFSINLFDITKSGMTSSNVLFLTGLPFASSDSSNAGMYSRFCNVVESDNIDAIHHLERPDCIFIGGGLNQPLLDLLWTHISDGTRIVANGVTIETDRVLTSIQARFGGNIQRLEISHLEGIGRMHGWKASFPITQWIVTKGYR